MGLLVINPGLHTTVQDLGRPGYREFGVPLGGAFDTLGHRVANALVGNAPDAATLELTLFGGVYQAEGALALALAGAEMEARLERARGGAIDLRPPQSFTLRPGDRLVLGGAARGARSYLAVAGGWQTSPILGSRSSEERLRAGNLLDACEATTPARRFVEHRLSWSAAEPIRVLEGPDASCLDASWRRDGLRVRVGAKADRMGIRLEGEALAVSPDPERLSTPVVPGAVQAAGDALILLGVASGTMGGYPHVAQVITADLHRLGQVQAGDSIRLEWIGLIAARRLDDERRHVWADQLMRVTALARDRR
jgi:biotin-dependent carboxylase-like uncharacterized protein